MTTLLDKLTSLPVCEECGIKLSYKPEYDADGLPCNKVCCGHCEWKKIGGKCPKEQLYGDFFDELKKFK